MFSIVYLCAMLLSLVCGLAVTPVVGSGGDRLIAQETSVSRAETEALVRQDLARRLKVPVEQVKLRSAVDRTWQDSNLGCNARKGLEEPIPVPGFAFTLAHGGKEYVYHTDRKGHFRRCDTRKPLGPISR